MLHSSYIEFLTLKFNIEVNVYLNSALQNLLHQSMGFMEKTGAWICGEMRNSPFRGRRHWSLGLQQAWGHRSVFFKKIYH